jgi:hypothetical protein
MHETPLSLAGGLGRLLLAATVPAAIGLLLVWLGAPSPARTALPPAPPATANAGESAAADSPPAAAAIAAVPALEAAAPSGPADAAPAAEAFAPAAAAHAAEAAAPIAPAAAPQRPAPRSGRYRTREIRVGASVIRLRFKGAEMQDWSVAATAPRPPAR